MKRITARAVWIIARREYLQRALTRSFVLSTIFTPVFFGFLLGLPILFSGASGKSGPMHKPTIAIAAPDQHLADIIRAIRGTDAESIVYAGPATASARRSIDSDLERGKFDAYLWIDDAATTSGRIAYVADDQKTLDNRDALAAATYRAIAQWKLERTGTSAADAQRITAPIVLDARALKPHRDILAMIEATVTVTIMLSVLLMSLLSYGVMVMRAVLDEKSSRITEILLCSATGDELMAGKIAGIGALGLTQIGAWIAAAAAIAMFTPSVREAIAASQLTPRTGVYFMVFFVLGYVLYSSMFAALGAAFNAVDEAQQWTFVLLIPLIGASGLITPVMSEPSGRIAIWGSMFPFTAPVLMFARIVAHEPPWWQIALSAAILTIAGATMIELCARIYRVGILMYGKRPRAREIARWLRYT